MIIQEKISDTLIKTYSDQKVLIEGGFPHGFYPEAIDPISANRTYIETNIPIEEEEKEREEEFSEVEEEG